MIRATFLAATALLAAAPLAAAPTTKAPDFIKLAEASDLYEKTSSQEILRTSTNAEVRKFATMMVADHGKTAMDVMAAAKTDGVKGGPPMLSGAQQAMIAQLKAAPVAKRDGTYVDQQVMAHEDALGVHTTYSKSGETRALKQAATAAVPVVAMHLNEVKAMRAKMAGR